MSSQAGTKQAQQSTAQHSSDPIHLHQQPLSSSSSSWLPSSPSPSPSRPSPRQEQRRAEPDQSGRSRMKSRRQSSGGSSAVCAAGEGNTHTHTHSSGGGGCKLERKDVEKNRRLHMKSLCLKLSSLLPPSAAHASLLSDAAAAAAANPNSKQDAVTQLDQLDSAAAYIKQLKERIEALKQRKAGCLGGGPSAALAASSSSGGSGVRMLPVIEVRYQDGTLDVVLISEAGRAFKLHEVITVLEQEGAEVVSASFSVIGDKIFYTIHSQQALSPCRVGLDADRVSQRLHQLLAAPRLCR